MANVTFTLLESKTMMMLMMMMMMMIRTEKLCSEDIEDLTLVFIWSIQVLYLFGYQTMYSRLQNDYRFINQSYFLQ